MYFLDEHTIATTIGYSQEDHSPNDSTEGLTREMFVARDETAGIYTHLRAENNLKTDMLELPSIAQPIAITR